jgi:hypothetical protein
MPKRARLSLAIMVLALTTSVLVGCETTPLYGPDTPRNGAGEPIDSHGIVIPGTGSRR